MKYVVHANNTMASGLIPYDTTPRDAKRYMVEGMTLDMLDQETGYSDRILLWMDIEGYELEALRTGPQLLSSGRIRWINLEVRSRWNFKKDACTESEIDEFLAGYGYRKVITYNHYPSSHHHDAIYIHDTESLAEDGQRLYEIYQELFMAGPESRETEDLKHRVVDLFLALTEQRDKVGYLRSKFQRP